jgi:hypothetical protein
MPSLTNAYLEEGSSDRYCDVIRGDWLVVVEFRLDILALLVASWLTKYSDCEWSLHEQYP